MSFPTITPGAFAPGAFAPGVPPLMSLAVPA